MGEVTIFHKRSRRVKGEPPEYEVRLWQDGKALWLYVSERGSMVEVPLALSEVRRMKNGLIRHIKDQTPSTLIEELLAEGEKRCRATAKRLEGMSQRLPPKGVIK